MAGCSTAVVTMCGGDAAPGTTPLITWLFASLPPLVSTISPGSHPSSDAMRRRAAPTASWAGRPAQCPLDGFPKSRSRRGRMAAATAGAIGVLAL